MPLSSAERTLLMECAPVCLHVSEAMRAALTAHLDEVNDEAATRLGPRLADEVEQWLAVQ